MSAESKKAAADRIRQLLRLAKSKNVHEAAAAAAGAQRVAERHALSVADVVADADEDLIFSDHFDEPLDVMARTHTWRIGLAMVIAQANGCEVLTEPRQTLQWCRRARQARLRGKRRPPRPTAILIVGPDADVSAVRYLFAYLSKEIERMAQRDCMGMGHEYGRSYRMGAVNTVQQLLHEAKLEARREFMRAPQQAGLVRCEGALAHRDAQIDRIRAWIEKRWDVKHPNYKPPTDARGYKAGLLAASDEISVRAGPQVGTGPGKLAGGET